MKKLFRSFLIAASISVLLHILAFVFTYATGKNVSEEINENIKVLPLSISLLFFPIFFSLFFYKKDNKIVKNLLKPAITSGIIMGIFEILFFEFIENRPNFKYFDVVLLRVFSFSFFISFFISFIQILKDYKFIKKTKNYKEVKLDWRIIVLIPFTASTIYSILFEVASSTILSMLNIWSSSIPLGVTLCFLSFHFFKNLNHTNRKLKIISFYFISIFIFFSIWISSYLVFSHSTRSIYERLHNLLIPSFVLFSHYFLFIVLTTHFYFLYLFNKQEKAILTQLSLESQLNYQQLKNQISPHFLFNNINVLTSLIEENPEKAVQFSENLSHIYRYFLEQEKQDVVLVKDEIEFAKSYLELLNDRFEVGLNYSISVDKNAEEKYIVSTILQQVLENVVKHNTINESNIVDVKILSEEDYLIIENNKNSKIESHKNSKKGIDNMKKRIAFFTDEKVIIEESETNYIIKLPILNTVE